MKPEKIAEMSPTGCCVSCGGELKWLMPYRFKSEVFKKSYLGAGIFSCFSCALQQVDMALVDVPKLLDYYSSGPYRHDASIAVVSEQNVNWYEARGRAIADMARRHGPAHPTNVFEVGAGYCTNLVELRKVYPDATYATDEIDSTVALPQGVARAELKTVAADIIVLSHVLEHFSDPVALIREVVGALKARGIAIIEVPNDEPAELATQHYHEPHLTFFDSHSIVPLLERAGARVVELMTAGPKSTAFHESTKLRTQLRSVAIKLPVIKDFLARRRKALSFNFTTPTEHGIFLRVTIQTA